MSGAARRARQLRRKPSSPDDDSGDEAGGSGVRPPAPPARRPSVLSFGDDEAGAVVKPRKKDRVRASGLRVGGEAGGVVAARSEATGELNGRRRGGGAVVLPVPPVYLAKQNTLYYTHTDEYTAERLAELASAHARPPAPRGGTDATPADEPAFRLAGSFKATTLDDGGGGDVGGVEAAGGDTIEDAPPLPSSSLPDAATIAAARAARERARRGEASADDFIPLDGGGGRRPRDARLAFGVGADRARARWRPCRKMTTTPTTKTL